MRQHSICTRQGAFSRSGAHSVTPSPTWRAQVPEADIDSASGLPSLTDLPHVSPADAKVRPTRHQLGSCISVSHLPRAGGPAASARVAGRPHQSPCAPARPRPAAQELLAQTAVLKLNGGLGTSMGLEKAKSLLEVKDVSCWGPRAGGGRGMPGAEAAAGHGVA
jgi:hypothetical protein